jgi:hypothetical protein
MKFIKTFFNKYPLIFILTITLLHQFALGGIIALEKKVNPNRRPNLPDLDKIIPELNYSKRLKARIVKDREDIKQLEMEVEIIDEILREAGYNPDDYLKYLEELEEKNPN